MKSGRNISLEDGGADRGTRTGSPMKSVRIADMDKRRPSGRGQANPREVKASSIVNLPEPRRKGPAAFPGPKPKISPRAKTEDGHVGSSIKKLRSVYEAPGEARKPDDARTHATAKPIEAKPVEGQAPRKQSSVSYDLNGRRRHIPVLVDRTKASEAKLPQVKSVTGKKEESQLRKPVPRKRTTPVERKMKTAEEDDNKTPPVDDRGAEKERKELVPTLPASNKENNPVSIINSFTSDYLDEENDNRSRSKPKMDFVLPSLEEGAGNVLAVTSKRAIDTTPNSGLPEALSPDNSEFILMLRRRNSEEPHSEKSCLLYGVDPEKSNPSLSVGLSCETLENYLFWEPGPAHLNKPYWEVSLFKSNRSSSLVNTTTPSGQPLAPIEQRPSLILNGRFNKSISGAIRGMAEPPAKEIKTCLPDVKYCKTREGAIRALSFITLMDSGLGIPNELGHANMTEGGGPNRVTSKDDNYKPPANLLVYVRSSKKLIAFDGSESDYGGINNKKLHKVTKVRREESEARPTLRQKVLALAVVSAVLLTTGIIFFIQFLMKRPAYFNLTPPIPGLVRGC